MPNPPNPPHLGNLKILGRNLAQLCPELAQRLRRQRARRADNDRDRLHPLLTVRWNPPTAPYSGPRKLKSGLPPLLAPSLAPIVISP